MGRGQAAPIPEILAEELRRLRRLQSLHNE